jgi:hypothetical protein
VELVSVADAFNGMVRGAIANRGVLVEVPDTDFLELVGSEVMSKMSLWAPGVQSIPTLNPGESPCGGKAIYSTSLMPSDHLLRALHTLAAVIRAGHWSFCGSKWYYGSRTSHVALETLHMHVRNFTAMRDAEPGTGTTSGQAQREIRRFIGSDVKDYRT